MSFQNCSTSLLAASKKQQKHRTMLLVLACPSRSPKPRHPTKKINPTRKKLRDTRTLYFHNLPPLDRVETQIGHPTTPVTHLGPTALKETLICWKQPWLKTNSGPTLQFPTVFEEDKPLYAQKLEFAPVDVLLQLSKSARFIEVVHNTTDVRENFCPTLS